jgi:hypothetical protein
LTSGSPPPRFFRDALRTYAVMLSRSSWISLGVFLARYRPKEWIELYEKGMISREELQHQLARATINLISSPMLNDSLATYLGVRSRPSKAGTPAATARPS